MYVNPALGTATLPTELSA